MSDLKEVKVDNWGVYFLQRLKHFFNRTDYCDLTLQFQDNAQLKVHRLVLSACTEYFELLERTCEMYEDCLVMPDDLQADVVVPIVNFMYTGQLEFKPDLLERLYVTSQVMNMPVLTKLLESQRVKRTFNSYNANKRIPKKVEVTKPKQHITVPAPTPPATTKRSYSKAFESAKTEPVKIQKKIIPSLKKKIEMPNSLYGVELVPQPASPVPKKSTGTVEEARPTRYELPEELDTDNIFANSFVNISYTSQPLMVHPEVAKKCYAKKSSYNDASSSKKGLMSSAAGDMVECKKISTSSNIFEDDVIETEEPDFASFLNVKNSKPKNSNQLFDQIMDCNEGPKVTVETKDGKQSSNLDHAKIISEVLKKYPHLVKSNKNIKLKILDTPKKLKKQVAETPREPKCESPEFTYESDVVDSKLAAKLISLGAENVKGPWICLICGTPGKALHFTSYYKFRCHLVEVHKEMPVITMCEYCGLKSPKRNYLMYHKYTKHGVPPLPNFHFPKCNLCNYIALTEAFLIKHKMSHADVKGFRCNVCASTYSTAKQLLTHIQSTGHKYSADRKANLLCVYCLKVFLRENNLYTHLKTHHKQDAKSDGIIDDSDDEQDKIMAISSNSYHTVKQEENYESDYEEETQYEIQPDGNIHVVTKKQSKPSTPQKQQKILNSKYGLNKRSALPKNESPSSDLHNDLYENDITPPQTEEIIMIDNNEYIMRDNQLYPKKSKHSENEILIPHLIEDHDMKDVTPTTSESVSYIQHDEESESKFSVKKSEINEPIEIVVSNEDDYKAIMASHQSIIFDENDTNKTLTVLTAPHTSAVAGTTINLDDTQSNNMMIIQDNYPLNVSEAVGTDNSNIVVVYSHAVDDQSKYQFITPQEINAQFIPTSAVVSETVTTSAPIMNTEVIEAQIPVTWPSTIQQNLNNVEPAEITTIHADNATPIDLEELPEVQLAPIDENLDLPQNGEDNDDENTHTTTNETQENGSLTPQDNMEADTDLNPTSPTNVDPIEPASEINSEITMGSPDKSANVEEINNEEETSNVTEDLVEQVQPPLTASETQLENADLSVIETNENQTEKLKEVFDKEVIDDTERVDIEPIEPNLANDVSLNSELAVENVESNSTISAPPREEPKVQIQTLTSEWSEEEDEIPKEKEPKESEGNIENEINPTEVEESIENIQQEVDKEIASATKEHYTPAEVTSSDDSNLVKDQNEEQLNDITTVEENETGATHSADVIPNQEKISELLNDWDENDSQESTSANDGEEVVDTAEKKIETQVLLSTDVKKDDNIKSLVSDWDEEEEEETKD